MFRLTFLLAVLPAAAPAVTLDLPATAALRGNATPLLEDYALPLGPWTEEAFPVEVLEGPVTRQVWSVPGTGLTSLQLMLPLRSQLEEAGYKILFECDTEDCGGYDFRFGTEVAPAPDMQVALGDFRFLSAKRDDEAVSLFVSRSAREGFIQVIQVGALGNAPLVETKTATVDASATLPQQESGEFGPRLESLGSVILSDLSFDSGSAQLGSGTFESLEELAAYLAANPSRRIALVGHTDTSGSLAGNIALSKRRAGSVLERLVSAYGVNRAQLDAEGMGYLSPVAANLTEEGREANRRVEAVLLSLE